MTTELICTALCVISALLGLGVGYLLGWFEGKKFADHQQVERIRDAAVEACMSRHPAGGSKPHMRLVD